MISLFKKKIPNHIKIYVNKLLKRNITFSGNYKTWNEALINSSGYDNEIIINKKIKSFLIVKKKKSKYENDTVLFNDKKINEDLVKIFNYIGYKKTLNLLDFGGSLGSLYFQHLSILKKFPKFRWNIVEQKKLVDFARKNKIKNLNFYYSIFDFLNKKKASLIIFSSVLQYVEDAKKIIQFCLKKNVKYIAVLKTPFSFKKELIKVQHVPKNIYNASYPFRIFNMNDFLKIFFKNNYKLVDINFQKQDISSIIHKSFLFEKC